MKKISSSQNTLIKEVIKLQEKSRERKKKGLFIVEGIRELELAQKGEFILDTLFFDETKHNYQKISENYTANTYVEITSEVYKKIAYRASTEGILSIVEAKDVSLQNLSITSKEPLILVLEALEKPGNIGAILRTADAAKVDAVLIADAKTDIYNPNIIRSSVGCVFTNQIAIATSEDIIKYLQENSINIYSATLQNSNEYHQEDYTKPTAIVVGTEATGLTQIWRESATQNINIPMQGAIDSMNVSVACAIITFEAKRQRGF